MIHPEHIDTVAARAYGYFKAKYADHPDWPDLPESTRIKWRDDVVAADRVRNKIATATQEQCCFDALAEYYAAEQCSSVEAPADEPAPVADTDKRPKLKRGK